MVTARSQNIMCGSEQGPGAPPPGFGFLSLQCLMMRGQSVQSQDGIDGIKGTLKHAFGSPKGGSLADISKSVGLGRREGYVGTMAGWGLGKGEGRRRFLGRGRGRGTLRWERTVAWWHVLHDPFSGCVSSRSYLEFLVLCRH